MSDFRGVGGVQNFWIIEGKNRIKGGRGGSKMTQKNRTSFMNDPLSKLKKTSDSMPVKADPNNYISM